MIVLLHSSLPSVRRLRPKVLTVIVSGVIGWMIVMMMFVVIVIVDTSSSTTMFSGGGGTVSVVSADVLFEKKTATSTTVSNVRDTIVLDSTPSSSSSKTSSKSSSTSSLPSSSTRSSHDQEHCENPNTSEVSSPSEKKQKTNNNNNNNMKKKKSPKKHMPNYTEQDDIDRDYYDNNNSNAQREKEHPMEVSETVLGDENDDGDDNKNVDDEQHPEYPLDMFWRHMMETQSLDGKAVKQPTDDNDDNNNNNNNSTDGIPTDDDIHSNNAKQQQRRRHTLQQQQLQRSSFLVVQNCIKTAVQSHQRLCSLNLMMGNDDNNIGDYDDCPPSSTHRRSGSSRTSDRQQQRQQQPKEPTITNQLYDWMTSHPSMILVENAITPQQSFEIQALSACLGSEFGSNVQQDRPFEKTSGGNQVTFLSGSIQLFLPHIIDQLASVTQLAYDHGQWDKLVYKYQINTPQYMPPPLQNITTTTTTNTTTTSMEKSTTTTQSQQTQSQTRRQLGLRTSELLSYKKYRGGLGGHTDTDSMYTVLCALSHPKSYDGGKLWGETYYMEHNHADSNSYPQHKQHRMEFKLPQYSCMVFLSHTLHGVTSIENGHRKTFANEFWHLPDSPFQIWRPDKKVYQCFVDNHLQHKLKDPLYSPYDYKEQIDDCWYQVYPEKEEVVEQ